MRINKNLVHQVGDQTKVILRYTVNQLSTLYMFRTVSPPIIRSLRLYMQHQVYVIQVLWLLASKRPSETCRVLFQNKIISRYCASGWFCYRNILRCTVLQTSKIPSCGFHREALRCIWIQRGLGPRFLIIPEHSLCL